MVQNKEHSPCKHCIFASTFVHSKSAMFLPGASAKAFSNQNSFWLTLDHRKNGGENPWDGGPLIINPIYTSYIPWVYWVPIPFLKGSILPIIGMTKCMALLGG